MDVAVRELKAKLSAYLRQAAAGETITVTFERDGKTQEVEVTLSKAGG